MDSADPHPDPDLALDLDPDLGSGPTTFRLRDETDLIALVATTLGFHPTRSIVLLCVDDDGRVFQARCDLAPSAHGIPDVVDSLLSAALRNGGCSTFLLTYTDDTRLSRAHLRAVTRELVAAGREVVLRLRVHEGRWFPAAGQSSPETRFGVPFDLGSHPLMARRVLRGEVMHADRDELVRSLDPTPGAEADAVAAAYARLGRLDRGPVALRREAAWLRRALGEEPGSWPPETLARVLRAVAVGRVRDEALGEIQPHTAEEWLRVWTRVMRLAPAEAAAAPAALLGFAAWMGGDGALAWCGVERAFAVDRRQSLARLVSDLLEAAVPPTAWPDPVTSPARSSARRSSGRERRPPRP
jgi:hypothetical protein